jgi:hypothetical protein
VQTNSGQFMAEAIPAIAEATPGRPKFGFADRANSAGRKFFKNERAIPFSVAPTRFVDSFITAEYGGGAKSIRRRNSRQ